VPGHRPVSVKSIQTALRPVRTLLTELALISPKGQGSG